ncbi:MAG TPA: beta-N-acetylhexosaminidase [Polyangiaceae bacterium LLY-WYZ-15_(1-7)]|nr:beta-N-acetylhexosaminidase [Sandaracinus sp.]HJL05512.1 beta-N-acetylhexosaminidase [Polyangiaceae bacterium LLY-WYZ-15_(1-7)]HJL13753.1 beta-N-acetylhexosaminidase [Polyangiaceae bacterium LLY-WYZ-15_(1-7)]
MDLDQLAGQTLVAGYPAGPAPKALRAALAADALAGAILFKRNVGTPAETAAALATLREGAPGPTPLLCVDQEGGRVARLGPPVLALPPMRRLGERDDPALTRRLGAELGRQLAAIGFTMDFAPVLDVDTNPANPVIGDRSFGRSPERVIRHGGAFAEGLLTGGVLPCGKHFPGHGDTDLDSHLALPTLRHDAARLEAVELAPFRALAARLPALMTAHVVYEALDPAVPATLSRAVVTGLLREQLGYDGVVISDDLEMKAVAEGWGVVEGAVAAIEAGCDLLLVCSDLDACFQAREALARRADRDVAFRARLEEAAGRVRALRAKAPSRAVAPDALEATLASDEARALETLLEEAA